MVVVVMGVLMVAVVVIVVVGKGRVLVLHVWGCSARGDGRQEPLV